MPNEYGKILLQQIEQQRRQRLRQRAEERGLPIPSDEQLGLTSSSAVTQAADNGAEISTSCRSGCSGDTPLAIKTANRGDDAVEKNVEIHQSTTKQSTDVANAIQSLLMLAPLLAGHAAHPAQPAGAYSMPYMPSVVPTPLTTQHPLIVQPAALAQPSMYSSPQQVHHHPLHSFADERQVASVSYDAVSTDATSLQRMQPYNKNTEKELPTGRETYTPARQPSSVLPMGTLDTSSSRQSLQDAKKRYQADLLQQMKEREAQREAEKSRRRREDEEERIRLSREIEQERLEKEEEEARQLSKSKQLAAANVAAAGPIKQRRFHQIPCNDTAESIRQDPVRPRLLVGCGEELDEPAQTSTIKFAADMKLNECPEVERVRQEMSCDNFARSIPRPGSEVERLLILGMEGLKAELKTQREEMRLLQRLLQHMHQDKVLRGCDRQRLQPDVADSSAWHAAMPTENMHSNNLEFAEKRALQNQCALITLILKSAGVSDPADLVRRLAESGALSRRCDIACQGALSCHGNTAITEQIEQNLRMAPSGEEEPYGVVSNCIPPKHSLSRGLSNSSYCSASKFTAEPIQDQIIGHREESMAVENPEERPLPTLLKRKQQEQPNQRPHEPATPQLELKTAVDRKKSPAVSANESTRTSEEKDVGSKLHDEAETLQCRGPKETHATNSICGPAERRWRLNELLACVSHGFSPPPPYTSDNRPFNALGENPLSSSTSWCTSDCESELPCQTVPLPSAGCNKTSFGVDLSKQRMRQIDGLPKNGWPPVSQMESLEESTCQTATSEEPWRPAKPEEDLYTALLAKVNDRRVYEGIRVVPERPKVSKHMGSSTVQPEPGAVHPSGQSVVPTAEKNSDVSKTIGEEDSFGATDYRRLCRALSVSAAPLQLQRLHELECRLRQQYDINVAPRVRAIRQLQAIPVRRRLQEGPHLRAASIPRAQERFKSRLSWEADTAFPVDEGCRAQSHVTQAQVNIFGARPFAPLLQPPLKDAAQSKNHPCPSGNPDSTNPTPATPPNKHTLPLQNPSHSSSVPIPNKRKSRLSRVFNGMLLRSNSRPRQ